MRSAAVLVLLALVVAGCGKSATKTKVDRGALGRIVLQPSDLPGTFDEFDVGPQLRSDAQPGARADPARFGRLGGWKARFRRNGPVTAPGPVVVESRADVFANDHGAEQDLQGYRQDLSTGIPGGPTATVLRPPRIGDATVAVRLDQSPARFFTIAWREANATASLTVQGFAKTLSLEDALRLARKQERHLLAALR